MQFYSSTHTLHKRLAGMSEISNHKDPFSSCFQSAKLNANSRPCRPTLQIWQVFSFQRRISLRKGIRLMATKPQTVVLKRGASVSVKDFFPVSLPALTKKKREPNSSHNQHVCFNIYVETMDRVQMADVEARPTRTIRSASIVYKIWANVTDRVCSFFPQLHKRVETVRECI